MDDIDLAVVQVTPYYGGHPSPLADPTQLERAKSLLLAGERIDVVADELGYHQVGAFSNAFRRFAGMRPGAFQQCNGVEVARRSRRATRLGDRAPVPLPNRSGQKPYPTYEQSATRRKARLRKYQLTRTARLMASRREQRRLRRKARRSKQIERHEVC